MNHREEERERKEKKKGGGGGKSIWCLQAVHGSGREISSPLFFSFLAVTGFLVTS